VARASANDESHTSPLWPLGPEGQNREKTAMAPIDVTIAGLTVWRGAGSSRFYKDVRHWCLRSVVRPDGAEHRRRALLTAARDDSRQDCGIIR